jgi:hypothetical protein
MANPFEDLFLEICYALKIDKLSDLILKLIQNVRRKDKNNS